jgi:Fic family protein
MKKKPYIPKKLNIKGLDLDYNKFAPELSKAQYVLGQLQGSQKKMQNPNLLVSPLTAKEATTSSRIEGTQSDVGDLFTYEAGGEAKYDDVIEVINYRKTINY